jgi:hypothetical protein
LSRFSVLEHCFEKDAILFSTHFTGTSAGRTARSGDLFLSSEMPSPPPNGLAVDSAEGFGDGASPMGVCYLFAPGV